MPQLPGSIALVGTDSLSTGVVGWLLRRLLSSSFDQCPYLISTAVEAAHSACELSCPSVNSVDWIHLFNQITSDQLRIFGLGVCIGLSLFLIIDILYVLKEWWRFRVWSLVRILSLRPTGNTYLLPLHAAPGR